MPCYDSRNEAETPKEFAKGLDSFQNWQRHNSHLAQMLCFLCEVIERGGDMSKFPVDIQQWWEEHKDRDGRRGGRVCL